MLVQLGINENNLIEWDEMINPADDTYVNDATVTFTLVDSSDVDVPSAIGLSMSYVAASDGKYQGTLPKAVAATLTQGAQYSLEVTATGTVEGFRKIACKASYHGAE